MDFIRGILSSRANEGKAPESRAVTRKAKEMQALAQTIVDVKQRVAFAEGDLTISDAKRAQVRRSDELFNFALSQTGITLDVDQNVDDLAKKLLQLSQQDLEYMSGELSSLKGKVSYIKRSRS
jgi:hypothetical protein